MEVEEKARREAELNSTTPKTVSPLAVESPDRDALIMP
jgi:hypothetical protein